MLHTFSVAANRPVRFSQGNLQYRASTGTWRFAPNQWEMRGEENNQRGEDYSGWIDLFCWGATGYNGRLPYVVPTSSEGFRQGDIANTDYDWGHYLPIANGGNQANRWRTLTGEEWTYLFRGRPQAERLFGSFQPHRCLYLFCSGLYLRLRAIRYGCPFGSLTGK